MKAFHIAVGNDPDVFKLLTRGFSRAMAELPIGTAHASIKPRISAER